MVSFIEMFGDGLSYGFSPHALCLIRKFKMVNILNIISFKYLINMIAMSVN